MSPKTSSSVSDDRSLVRLIVAGWLAFLREVGPPVYASLRPHLYFLFTRFHWCPVLAVPGRGHFSLPGQERTTFHAETHIPAQPPPPFEDPRLSCPYEDQAGARGHLPAP